MKTGATQMEAQFNYSIDRTEDGDYDAFVLGEYIGTAKTYGDGEDMIREYRSDVYYRILQQGCADAHAVTD